MADVRETVHAFGPSQALVGVLAQPADPPVDVAPDVALVIVNAGVIHRVGPNRLHVGLARTVTASGYPSFRFDLPGIGDSGTLRTAGSSTEEAMAGVRAALDDLARRGVAKRFVLFGLCSGADLGFLAGCLDPRIIGLALVDPNRVFETRKSRLIWGLRTAARPGVWFRALCGHYGLWGRVRARLRRRPGDPSGPAGSSEAPLSEAPLSEAPMSEREAHARAEEGLRMLIARDVRILYILTGQYRSRYMYRRQFHDAFPSIAMDEHVVVDMFFDADHTFPRQESRARLERVLDEWLRGAFPGKRPATSEAGVSPRP